MAYNLRSIASFRYQEIAEAGRRFCLLPMQVFLKIIKENNAIQYTYMGMKIE